jgi:tyrosinase
MMQRWTSQALLLPPRASWQRADLEFEGVEHDGASFVLHVFLNNDSADEATPRTAAEGYAGYLTVFAHGDCWGDAGHCDITEPVSAFDRRPPQPLIPFNATLEVSEALDALPEGTQQFTVTTLAFNKADDSAGVLRFSQLTLLTYA